MSTKEKREEPDAKPKPKSVKVTVNFPISPSGPFRVELAGATPVGEVRQDAMTHFGVAEDSQHAYYLTHSGAKVADERTVGEAAGSAQSVKFTLVKELIQG